MQEENNPEYYEQFVGHENTLAATLNGSIQKDVYYSKARGYNGSLTAALFPDNLPHSVYDNLIAAVFHRAELPRDPMLPHPFPRNALRANHAN